MDFVWTVRKLQTSICKSSLLFIILLIMMISPVFSITITMSSNNAASDAFMNQHYEIDKSTDLIMRASLGEGIIKQYQWASGYGSNKISQYLSNRDNSAQFAVSSSSFLGLSSNTLATGTELGISTSLGASGETKCQLSGSTESSFAAQETWTLAGSLASNQALIVQDDRVRADQRTGIVGALGYSFARSGSGDKEVEVTGGLNGQGLVFSQMTATASNEAIASGEVKGLSQDSKSYATARATSAQEETYSYLSSSDGLHSILAATANEHSGIQQDVTAENGVLAYASAKDGTDLLHLAEEGSKASGSLIACTNGPLSINKDLTGDTKSIILESEPLAGAELFALPLPSSTKPSSLIDKDNIEHIFVRGADSALWDNKGGNWYFLGGVIDHDPSAVMDSSGSIHIFVRGADLALWDRKVTNTMGGNWNCLGGQITSSPSAIMEPGFLNWIAIGVRGTDNALWIRDLNANSMTDGGWSYMGGSIKDDPFLIASNDGSNYVYTLVRGADDALWINKADTGPTPVSPVAWYGFGGNLASEFSGAIEPVSNGFLKVAGRGSDNALWMCDIDLTTSPGGKIEYAWSPLGGVISSSPYTAFDISGNIHTFVRGSDNQLWDNKGIWANGVYTHNWYPLGGTIASDPNPLMNTNTGKIDIAVQGGDRALWVNRMSPNSPAYFNWYGLGGVIA
jgi:sialidase-1